MKKLATTTAVGAVLLLGSATLVSASIPDADGTFHGCVNNLTGVVRVVDPAKSGNLGRCITTGPAVLRETAITFNAQGAPGPQGAAGPQGPEGPQGPPGPSGGSPPVAHTEVVGRLAVPNLFAGEIQVRGVGWGIEMTAGPPGGGGGKLVLSPLTIVKPPDSASASLMTAAASGVPSPVATLQLTDAQGAPYLSIEFRNVVVSSVVAGSGNAAGESVTLLYGSFAAPTSGAGAVPAPAAPVATLSSPELPVTSPLSAFHWDIANPGAPSAITPKLGDAELVMPLDANAVTLLTAVATGRSFDTMTITRPSASGDDTTELQTAVPHIFSLAATGAVGDVPSATVTLTPGRVVRTVGGNTCCFDASTNTSC